VFFSVMAGAFSLGNALPFVNAVSTAVGAASTIFAIVDRTPDIDVLDPLGLKPKLCMGKIQFQTVTFAYPTRPEVKVRFLKVEMIFSFQENKLKVIKLFILQLKINGIRTIKEMYFLMLK